MTSVIKTDMYRGSFFSSLLTVCSNIHHLSDNDCIWILTTLQERALQYSGSPPLPGCPRAAAVEKH